MNTEKTAIRAIAGAARCPEYSPSMVKALMKKLETNEKAFAAFDECYAFYGTPLDDWRCRPCSMARRLMQIYDSGSEVVSKIADAAGALEERRPKADGTKQSANRGK